jgi:hypothetical protein
MKKIYIIPQTKYSSTKLESTIAFSITVNNEQSGINFEDSEGDGSDQAVSHFNVWDE